MSFNDLLKQVECCKDVTPIVKAQKSTLLRYEEINEMLRQFLELSTSAHSMLLENYTTHTQTLIDLRKDLEVSFRRIRALKMKLKENYPEAFEATSAAIQELEDKNKQFQGEDEDDQLNEISKIKEVIEKLQIDKTDDADKYKEATVDDKQTECDNDIHEKQFALLNDQSTNLIDDNTTGKTTSDQTKQAEAS